MKAGWKILLGLSICPLTLLLAGCGEPVSNTYGYLVHPEAPTDTHLVEKLHKTHPFTFHPDSNPQMLAAFNALKEGIRLPGADGKRIFLTGIYDPETETFKLETWFITTPFFETVFEENRGTFSRRRQRLKQSDFYSQVDLNLNRLQRSARLETARKYGGAGNYQPEDFE
ncbi:MAG: hypothetical protein JXA52_01290 [Planctomycetes bacterium]|nr:hypothetical protein [Planctomycetota bacterium]